LRIDEHHSVTLLSLALQVNKRYLLQWGWLELKTPPNNTTPPAFHPWNGDTSLITWRFLHQKPGRTISCDLIDMGRPDACGYRGFILLHEILDDTASDLLMVPVRSHDSKMGTSLRYIYKLLLDIPAPCILDPRLRARCWCLTPLQCIGSNSPSSSLILDRMRRSGLGLETFSHTYIGLLPKIARETVTANKL